MRISLSAAAGLLALASCQPASAPTAAGPPASAPSSASAPTPTPTAEAARAAVAQYIQGQPNAARYVPDSASVVDADTQWQVLVPRTDWAGRRPNKAAFNVDKATGAVTSQAVK